MSQALRSRFVEGWRQLIAGRAGDRDWRALRIALQHPLEVFAAVRERDGAKSVLFECDISAAPSAKLRFDSEGLLLVDERESGQGRARAAIVLERPDLESILLSIGEDLVEASEPQLDAASALLAIAARLAAWQTCLKLRKDGFGRERMIGLYGELLTLDRLSRSAGLPRALAAWSGPDRAIHDFRCENRAIEVKTTVGGGGAVKIGNLEQLDDSGLRSLVLLHVSLVADNSGKTIHDLVRSARSMAQRFGAACGLELDRKLLMTGYLDERAVDRAECEAFSERDTAGYNVTDGFPRLIRGNVPTGIVAATYLLSTPAANVVTLTSQELDVSFEGFLSSAL